MQAVRSMESYFPAEPRITSCPGPPFSPAMLRNSLVVGREYKRRSRETGRTPPPGPCTSGRDLWVYRYTRGAFVNEIAPMSHVFNSQRLAQQAIITVRHPLPRYR